MAWEVYTYGGGEYLRVVFNGVAAIMGHTEYSTLLRIFLIATVLWIIARIAFVTQRPTDMTGLLGVFALLFVAFVPKVDVIVKDRIDPAMGSVVSNVPLGVGFTASFASKAGDWMTRAFEAVLSLPNDLQYQRNGMLFGARLVEASTRFDFTDGRLRENLSSFWRQCVMYDIALGLYSWDDITWEGDLWGFFKTNTSVSRMFPYRDAAGNKTLVVCRTGANTLLDSDVTVAVDQAMRFYSKRFYEKDPTPAAVAKFAAVLPVSYQYVTGLALSASDIMRQNLMINALRRGIASYATSAGATAAAVDYAIARAEAERRTTFQAMGELALRTLPLLRNIFEALIYGIFPIVLLVAVLAPRIAMVSYLKSLFWIQLWAPLYAILHFGMMFYGQSRGTAGVVGPLGTSALTLATATELGGVLQDMGYIAGYMAMLIPLMSYMLVQTGGALMASVGSSIMMGIQQTAARAADEATMGNIRMGNVALDNINWMKQDTSVLHRSGIATYTDHMGATHTYTPGGLHTIEALRSRLAAEVNTEHVARSAESRAHQIEATAVRQAAVEHASSVAAAMDRIAAFERDTGSRVFHGTEFTDADRAAWDRMRTWADEQAHRISDRFGIEQSVARRLALTAAADVGMGVSPAAGLAAFKAQLGARGELSRIEEDRLREAWESAYESVDREVAQRAVGLVKSYAVATRSGGEESGGVALSDALRASFREIDETGRRLQALRAEAHSYRDLAEELRSAGTAARAALTDAFLRDLKAGSGAAYLGAVEDPRNAAPVARAMHDWALATKGGRTSDPAAAADALRRHLDGEISYRHSTEARVAARVAGGRAAVEGFYRDAEAEVTARREKTLDAAARQKGEVLVKAAGRGLEATDLGHTPLTTRKDILRHQQEVSAKVGVDAPVETAGTPDKEGYRS